MSNSGFTSRTPVEFIIGEDFVLEGEFRSVLSPRIIDRILSIMPIKSRIHLWKQELYFEIGIRMGIEKTVSPCNAGDIAYWPQGDAVCLFFDTMTPYSKVSPLGHLAEIDFKTVFKQIQSGMTISLILKS